MNDTEDYFIAATASAVAAYVLEKCVSRRSGINFSKKAVLYHNNNASFSDYHLLQGKYLDDVVKLGGGTVDIDTYAGTWYSIDHVDLFCESLESKMRSRPVGAMGLRYGDRWLSSAIEQILEHGTANSEDDFDIGNRDQVELWEPIQIEPAEDVSAAVDAAEKALEAIRSDNGYAATKPAERAEVLSALEAGIRQLREHAAISRAYFDNFIWQPLTRAAHTFGKSVVGIAVKAAQESLKAAFRRFFDGFWDQ